MKFIVGKSLYFLGQKMFYSPYLDIERKTKTSTKYVKKNFVCFCDFKRINDKLQYNMFLNVSITVVITVILADEG